MGKRIAVEDGDIVVLSAAVTFGYVARRRASRGDLVRLLDTFDVARFPGPQASTAVYREICWKCQGSGYLAHYAAFWEGECLACSGTGLGKKFAEGDPLAVVRRVRSRIASQARRDRERQARLDADRAEHEAWAAQHSELVAQAAEVRDACEQTAGAFGTVLLDLANRAADRPLTPAQIELFTRFYTQDSERNARRAAQAAGSAWLGEKDERIEFVGTVIFSVQSHNEFGTSTLMIMADGSGNRIKWWRNGSHTPDKGDVLTVRARIKDLQTDPEYGRTTVVTQGRVRDYVDAPA